MSADFAVHSSCGINNKSSLLLKVAFRWRSTTADYAAYVYVIQLSRVV